MYLSQYKSGPGLGPEPGFLAKAIHFFVKSGLWIAGLAFAALATIGTFFFAMAAILGAFILAGAVAIAWFLFKIFGRKAFVAKGFSARGFTPEHSETLDATRGPEGWTVHRKNAPPNQD